ncbi:MAG TPA: preprotein translocase subunit SecA [Burkholderiales bacterium]|nr:preprotein translocase subunit SecA [Burkholderiales bacterium]
MQRLLRAVFGSRNDRLLKQYSKTVAQINALEPAMAALSDAALPAKTQELKQRLADKLKDVPAESMKEAEARALDELLPEAFAVVREASKRTLEMRHFDVQLIGGMVLHAGKIAEMRTGEGKTLVATLPAYLNALTGKGVQIVTVNDYLASRDAEWMGKIYKFLGLTVGVILSQMAHEEKHGAYAADITYGTNNEFGFDYLRDNMAMRVEERFQRGLYFAIVDEVDSILIDEARTPLIISGPAEDRTDVYNRMNEIAPMLSRQATAEAPGDFFVDEKNHSVLLSEQGHEHAEALLGRAGMLPDGGSLYDPANINLMHHLTCALRAHNLFFRDRHYVVQGGEVVIVDEFTGRLMPGRRWSDGLHQAVEAKEHVAIQNENQTLASITFQNYFRMYSKLAGMTGTADTEAYEFNEIYGLETVVIPTHMPMIREDRLDQVYKTEIEKYQAVLADIRDCHKRGQPVLVGTTSIENSEKLAVLLQTEKLPHQVLNAKQHAYEAQIVVQAGAPGVVTIATNMAGRGTDIVLGGNVEKQVDALKADPNVAEAEKAARIRKLREDWKGLHERVVGAGGLHIIGTERHESRRIDNQLRGRSGRQGDPGSSRFYLSLEDPLLRIFAGDRIKAIMERLKMPEGEPIEHSIVTRSIESAQRKVEAHNFDIRKQLLEYDNVANDQRKTVYELRNQILDEESATGMVKSLRDGVVADLFRAYVPPESVEEQWDLDGLQTALAAELSVQVDIRKVAEMDPNMGEEKLLELLAGAADQAYAVKMKDTPDEIRRQAERWILLQTLDTHWREHLSALDHLRQGIHLRGYAQKNPKQEYKREAFELFSHFLDTVKLEVSRTLMNIKIRSPEEVAAAEAEAHRQEQEALARAQFQHAAYSSVAAATEPEAEGGDVTVVERPKPQPFQRAIGKVGRNDPCPCGSGKKYKHCHGRLS